MRIVSGKAIAGNLGYTAPPQGPSGNDRTGMGEGEGVLPIPAIGLTDRATRHR